MPLIEYKCDKCSKVVDRIVTHPIPERLKCETCEGEMHKQVSHFGSYKWGPGNNSASVVPKRYRGGR